MYHELCSCVEDKGEIQYSSPVHNKKQQPPAPPPAQDIALLQKEIAELKEQVKVLTELAARAQADLQNAKGRMERDGEDIRKFAAEAVLRRFLPTVDNFQRAFAHLPEDLKNHEWVKGVQVMEQEFLKQAAELGLKKFSPLGQAVDTARHEVLLTGPGAADTVIEVLEDGYELHDKVLRPAKVKVGEGNMDAEMSPNP